MKPKPSASVLRVLAALGLSLVVLAACKKREPEELAGAATEPISAPSFPLSSSNSRSAVFLPMPGTRVRWPVSCSVMALDSSSTLMPDRTASPMRAPTPVTLIKARKALRSARDENPYKMCASSRTCRPPRSRARCTPA